MIFLLPMQCESVAVGGLEPRTGVPTHSTAACQPEEILFNVACYRLFQISLGNLMHPWDTSMRKYVLNETSNEPMPLT